MLIQNAVERLEYQETCLRYRAKKPKENKNSKKEKNRGLGQETQ